MNDIKDFDKIKDFKEDDSPDLAVYKPIDSNRLIFVPKGYEIVALSFKNKTVMMRELGHKGK